MPEFLPLTSQHLCLGKRDSQGQPQSHSSNAIREQQPCRQHCICSLTARRMLAGKRAIRLAILPATHHLYRSSSLSALSGKEPQGVEPSPQQRLNFCWLCPVLLPPLLGFIYWLSLGKTLRVNKGAPQNEGFISQQLARAKIKPNFWVSCPSHSSWISPLIGAPISTSRPSLMLSFLFFFSSSFKLTCFKSAPASFAHLHLVVNKEKGAALLLGTKGYDFEQVPCGSVWSQHLLAFQPKADCACGLSSWIYCICSVVLLIGPMTWPQFSEFSFKDNRHVGQQKDVCIQCYKIHYI